MTTGPSVAGRLADFRFREGIREGEQCLDLGGQDVGGDKLSGGGYFGELRSEVLGPLEGGPQRPCYLSFALDVRC